MWHKKLYRTWIYMTKGGTHYQVSHILVNQPRFHIPRMVTLIWVGPAVILVRSQLISKRRLLIAWIIITDSVLGFFINHWPDWIQSKIISIKTHFILFCDALFGGLPFSTKQNKISGKRPKFGISVSQQIFCLQPKRGGNIHK